MSGIWLGGVWWYNPSMDSAEQMLWSLLVAVPLGVAVWVAVRMLGWVRSSGLRRLPGRWHGITGWHLMLGLVLLLAGMTLAGAVARAVSGTDPSGVEQAGGGASLRRMALGNLLAMVLASGPVAVMMVLHGVYLRPTGGLRGLRAVGLWPGNLVREVALGVLAGAIGTAAVMSLNSMVAAAAYAVGRPLPTIGHSTLEALRTSQDAVAVGLMMLGAVGLAPLLEEVLYRGLVQSGIGWMLDVARGRALDSDAPVPSRWLALALASAAFALVHLGAVPPELLPGLWVLSMVLGLVYERSGSLLPCVVAHALFNAVNIMLAFEIPR